MEGDRAKNGAPSGSFACQARQARLARRPCQAGISPAASTAKRPWRAWGGPGPTLDHTRYPAGCGIILHHPASSCIIRRAHARHPSPSDAEHRGSPRTRGRGERRGRRGRRGQRGQRVGRGERWTGEDRRQGEETIIEQCITGEDKITHNSSSTAGMGINRRLATVHVTYCSL